MMSNFELVQKYGATVFVVHKFLEENTEANATEIQTATGLSYKCISTCLNTLVDVKLLNKTSVIFNNGRFYKYSTTIQ